MTKRIGILTGGGDVPGLNVCIKKIVQRAGERDWAVIGLRRGFTPLVRIDPGAPETIAEWTLPLTAEAVRTIDRTGGTILHTARLNPSMLKRADVPPFLARSGDGDIVDRTDHALRVIEALKLDALIAIGGDGTLSFAARLHAEGVPVILVPKTMDNDVFGTDYCIGFSTAVTRSVDAVTALRTTAGSHERILVVELFGRLSGETALITGLLASADRTVIAEVPVDADRLADLLARDRAENPSRYAIAVVSEGATTIGGTLSVHGDVDEIGRRKLGGIGELLGEAIKRRTGIDVINQSLAYLMRSGPPDSFDRIAATSFGALAVDLLAARRTGLMTAIVSGRYTAVPAATPSKGKRRVDVAALYDAQALRPRLADVEGRQLFLS
ncbi:MAG: ATP-dependent 6-phosphofructokinase [Alphaproteobacteria bacterium]|nr:ATP-dependent 6-phosphofructokinase [Alphaproteobacteria bacterium]